jgi:hypothetical protein
MCNGWMCDGWMYLCLIMSVKQEEEHTINITYSYNGNSNHSAWGRRSVSLGVLLRSRSSCSSITTRSQDEKKTIKFLIYVRSNRKKLFSLIKRLLLTSANQAKLAHLHNKSSLSFCGGKEHNAWLSLQT